MEAESHQRSGEIHVIVGPMFAGKTTTLLRKVQSERGDGSDISDGHRLFDTSQNRNAITWTALISGYGQNGKVVEIAREYFSSVTRDYGIQPRAQHYAALVDVLGSAGRLEEAYEFVSNSPYKEHSVIWGAFLWACRIHGDRDLLKLAAKKYFKLEPESAGKIVAIIKSIKDTRYGLDSIVTHDGVKLPCWPLKDLSSFKQKFTPEAYAKLDVIGIDEAQFFEDLYDFCSEAADHDGKKVIVAGLDGDYLRRSFGSVLDIIPLADSVTKLTARCELCGKRAFFTLRKTEELQTELIGGADVYMPVCRQHYVGGQVAVEAARVVLESQVQCAS
ncbi:hypothetical protein C1H46_031943 [Malus baccata]|uniref:thymidine kinase n=1 Tax=Malus baccata TaxID=106549 RepID=A0A540L7P8_MALBA|nr:hypothetical protein C1H46_031943 [Malus baccata]